MNFIHKRLFGLSEPTDPLRKASSEQLDKETVTAQTTFPFSRFHLKRRKVKRTHQTEPADIRCTSTGTSFLSGATNVNINTTNIFLQSGRPVSVDPATFNFNHTETHNSSISTICRIAKTTEEITTKLDHVITLFDRIDGPYDLERSTPNETMGYNHAVLEESRMQVMDMAVMSPTSPLTWLSPPRTTISDGAIFKKSTECWYLDLSFNWMSRYRSGCLT
ncbi:hypothetical protein CPB83DRAFT_141017 [Crepidotus variabilis]|uniref:Uncharacterized protein n=1 Tax=Crepidotus variabilis TaxID=179855 RepID=A0A9P6E3X7_9AGAR|nr:hypothetical protein CPB83DRAFT_141017 [Crepidotus variabilis]